MLLQGTQRLMTSFRAITDITVSDDRSDDEDDGEDEVDEKDD